MVTKTVRSRFDHQIGDSVEGCKILEKRVIIPPQPSEQRRGVYDYVVEVPPVVVQAHVPGSGRRKPVAKSSRTSSSSAPEKGSYTRASPEEMTSVIRRVPSR
jgi:hypothetical protein